MTDLAAIPDLSPAEAAALNRLSLFTFDDLLRSNRVALVQLLPALTLAHVRRWQGFAELSGIAGITPNAAAALMAAGIDGIAEMARASLARLRAALPADSDDAIVNWLRDAVLLSQTGVLNGNIRLRDGTPIEGASVRVMGTSAISDARGRFRVTRLPLDARLSVSAIHPTLGSKLARDLRPTRTTVLKGQLIVLPGRLRAQRALSALRGDRLPPLGSAAITTRAESIAPPPGDVLAIIDRYANGDARTASRFLDFQDGRFIRRTYRIAEAALPVGLRDGDDLEWTGTLWALARISPREIGLRSRLAAVRRLAARAPLTKAHFERSIKAAIKAHSDI